MSFKARWKETRAGSALGAAVATLLGLCFLFFGVGQGLTHLSFDLPYAFRPAVKPEGVVIIYMDEDSHSALGQPFFAGWDRRIHARLLEQLKACSVKAVTFDILFDGTTTNDAALLQAASAFGKVIVGARFTPVGLGGGISFWPLRRPFDELQQVASWGVAEVPDADEVVRKHYRVAARHSTNLLSLAWRTAEVSGAARLPNPFALRYLNYYGPPGTIPSLSYVQVLSNNVPVAALSNKVVFVGALIDTGFTGGKGTDDFPTPYSMWNGTKSPGVELNATAYLNLARGDWLSRLSPVREFLLVIGAGTLFGFGLGFLRPLAAAGVAVAAMVLVFVGACMLMWQQCVWFSWAIIAGVQIPAAAVCAIVGRAQRLFQEQKALEKELAKASVAATGAPTTPFPAPRPAVAPPPPSQLVRQQVGEYLHTPSPGPGALAGGDALTVRDSAPPPVIPEYALLRRVGAGAYGEVWLGTNVLGAFRAIKIVYRHNFREDRPFEREFEGIKYFDPISRSHPGLVHLLHVGRNDAQGYFYYLMELADDLSGTTSFTPETYEPKTLGKEVQRRGRLDVEQCIQLGLALTDSLSCLHERGLIHRDIKPSNIIFVDGKPKLADIGLVTQIGDGGTFVGTEGFYPPEGPGSPAGDIYSLGKVLYEALTGLSRQRFPDLPANFDPKGDLQRFTRLNRIIIKACENNLRKRYASARSMHDELQQLTASRTRLRDFFKKRPHKEPQNQSH